ncbi:MAG: hypothetical protein HOV66_13580 [Streptomycetaceae bacterium]|nr:hypothetical protein [Streptomycetaceae bacterium]
MALPGVRLDSSIASHDKTRALLSDPSSKRWQAMTSYMFALGWCGEHGTNGRIPTAALPFVHGTPATAQLLVKHRLWLPDDDAPGWTVPNYAERQELAGVTELKRAAQRRSARRTNCKRYHGPNCGCWQHDQSDTA